MACISRTRGHPRPAMKSTCCLQPAAVVTDMLKGRRIADTRLEGAHPDRAVELRRVGRIERCHRHSGDRCASVVRSRERIT